MDYKRTKRTDSGPMAIVNGGQKKRKDPPTINDCHRSTVELIFGIHIDAAVVHQRQRPAYSQHLD